MDLSHKVNGRGEHAGGGSSGVCVCVCVCVWRERARISEGGKIPVMGY